MKIVLLQDRKRIPCSLPYAGADFVEVDGTCPTCGAKPYKARGGEPHPSADDRAWEATACCVACSTVVGTLRVEPSTIFGVREDQAVLCGRCRVY